MAGISGQLVSNLHQAGLSALREGRTAAAVKNFEQLTQEIPGDSQAWLGLAFARAQGGDNAGVLRAVDEVLRLEPRNLRGLLFKADHLERTGERRQALRFYHAALRVAGTDQHPADIMQGLARAQAHSDVMAREFEDYLMSSLRDKGFSAQGFDRFAESVDIVLGRKERLLQEPSRYYFPGLPNIAFYEREDFEWVQELEASTAAIREELQGLLQDMSRFAPYLEGSGGPVLNDDSNLDDMSWSAFYLWRNGKLIEENAALCPQTVSALSKVPMSDIKGQTPSALFSRLAPGTDIPPHHGQFNTRLICHLPIIVPPDCGALQVGNHQRQWEEGKVLVFDDSVLHSAWNHGAEQRVVLLFDIWRPELSTTERHWVSEMLMAVETYAEQS